MELSVPPTAKIQIYEAIRASDKQSKRGGAPEYTVMGITQESHCLYILRNFKKIDFYLFPHMDSTRDWSSEGIENPYPDSKVVSSYLWVIYKNLFLTPIGAPGASHVPSYLITIDGIEDFVFLLD